MASIPYFLIIGAQKAGTTAAARNLSLHPKIKVFSGTTEYGQKEMEFFNQHWERGIAWYASHFLEDSVLNGDKTAELLHRTKCHEKMFTTNPLFRLIVLLRSPVERCYSQWKMAALAKKDETDGFEAVVERDLTLLNTSGYRERFYSCHDEGISCWREGYLLKGMYAEQLESIYRWFPKEQVYIGICERIRQNMTEGYRKIWEFLGLDPVDATFAEHFIGRPSPPMSSQMRLILSDLYRQSNQRLFSLIGQSVPEWE